MSSSLRSANGGRLRSTVRARLRLSFLSFVVLSARRYAVARTIWAPGRGLSLSANAPAGMTMAATSTTTQITRSILAQTRAAPLTLDERAAGLVRFRASREHAPVAGWSFGVHQSGVARAGSDAGT